MTKNTLESNIVGAMIHRLAPPIGDHQHLGKVGEIVAAHAQDGVQITVLYADGQTEELPLKLGGRLFLLARDGADLDVMVQQYLTTQALGYALDRAKYGYRAPLDETVGYLLRHTGVEQDEIERVIGVGWAEIEKQADVQRKASAKAV